MAHNQFGAGKTPQFARRHRSMLMSPDELDRFAWSLVNRGTLVEGALLTLDGDDVHAGAVSSAHALCESRASSRPVRLSLGGGVASADQVAQARSRVVSELGEIGVLIEASKKKGGSDVLSMGTAGGPKANPRVVHLQNRLNNLGHRIQSDGKFGEITHEAVKDFQTKIGVDPTGEVDDETAEALRNGGKPKVDPEDLAPPPQNQNGAQDPNAARGQAATDGTPASGAETTSASPDGSRSRTVTIKLSEAREAVQEAVLSAEKRKNLPDGSFVFPDTREYPIYDEEHARKALQLGAAHESGARLATIRAKVAKRYPGIEISEADTHADFPSMQIVGPAAKGDVVCPECGAPVRSNGVCQRGHRVMSKAQLDEAWSPAARLAAIAARRRESSLKPTHQVRGDVGSLKAGESKSYDGPDGPITVSRHETKGAGINTFHVRGGGSHMDPDLARGERNIVGRHAAAREVSERMHNSAVADAAHGLELEDKLKGASKRVTVKSADGQKVHVSPDKGGFTVRHPGSDTPDSHHKTAEQAVSKLKSDVRSNGGHFLSDAKPGEDPLESKDPEGMSKDEVKERLSSRPGWDRVGEEAEKAFPDAGSPPSRVKNFVTGKMLDTAGEMLGGSEKAKAVTHGAKHFSPEHINALASAVTQAHAHTAHAASLLAPHAATLAPHLTRLVASARAAEADLEEAEASGEGMRIVTARARAVTLGTRLTGEMETVLSEWSDESRAAALLARKAHGLPSPPPLGTMDAARDERLSARIQGRKFGKLPLPSARDKINAPEDRRLAQRGVVLRRPHAPVPHVTTPKPPERPAAEHEPHQIVYGQGNINPETNRVADAMGHLTDAEDAHTDSKQPVKRLTPEQMQRMSRIGGGENANPLGHDDPGRDRPGNVHQFNPAQVSHDVYSDKGWAEAARHLASSKAKLPAGHPAHRYLDAAIEGAKLKNHSMFSAGYMGAYRRMNATIQKPYVQESAQTAALSVTPKPFSTSKTSNWVARAGGLPHYIQNIAHAIQRGGKTESEAISIAIGTCKRWAAGGGKVSPEVRAAAGKAIAEWEAKKGESHGESAAKDAS